MRTLEHGTLRACFGQYYKTDATMGLVIMKTLPEGKWSSELSWISVEPKGTVGNTDNVWGWCFVAC